MLASSSRVQLRYIKETVWGETPIAGNPRNLRITGESLNYSVSKEVSEEINADRASTSQIPVSAEASGTTNHELSYAEYDEFMSGTLQNPWTVYGTNGVGTTFGVDIAAGTITADAAPVGTSALTNLAVGQWFTLANLAPSSPNYRKAFRVHPTTAPTTTVITLDPATPGVVEAGVAGVAVANARLTNGVTQPSYTIEREMGDVTEFFAFRGMTPSSMTLSVSSGSRTTIDFDFMGRDAVRGTNATTLPGAPVASYAYDIMSGVSGTTCALLVNGAPLAGTFINSISLTYDNALRMQNALCSLGAVGIGAGTISATADVEIYFNNGAAFYDEFLENENVSLTFTTFDTNGNGYIWTLPKVNIGTYDVAASGRDQDLLASISTTALLDNANPNPALRKVIFIDRVGAAVTP